MGQQVERGRAEVHGRVVPDAGLGQTEVEVLRKVAPALGADLDQALGERQLAMKRRDGALAVERAGDPIQHALVLGHDQSGIARGVEKILDQEVALHFELLDLERGQHLHGSSHLPIALNAVEYTII